jgi:hypothetical protein
VLAHELAHVKRRDCLTRLVARVICSFLWFVPFVWASNSHLHDEQEEACDEAAVRGGTKPEEYAGYLVTLARALTRRDAVLAAIFLSRPQRSSLERRVVSLLRTGAAGPRRAPVARFARPFILCVICSLPFLLVNPAVGKVKRNYIDAEEALRSVRGEWFNPEYAYDKLPPLAPKIVVAADDTLEQWGRVDNFGPSYKMKLEMVRAWVGKDGCLYCNLYLIHPSIRIDSSTELWRVDRSGTVLEQMYRGGIDYRFADEFPEQIDPTPDPRSPDNYSVYYRMRGGAQGR